MDDGSTDNCLEICKDYKCKDQRIKILHQSNQGVSAARNSGLEAVTGDYIAFVDADDYFHPEMYERLYSLLTEHNADISACFSRGCWDSDYIEPLRDDIEINIYDNLGAIKSIFNPKYGINGVGVVVTNKLFKKSLFNNLEFHTKFRRGEDEHIICYLMQKASKYVITDERLYYYFNRPDSILHAKSTEEENKIDNSNLLEMYDGRLLLFREDKYSEIYNTCLFNMMNMTISFFLNVTDKKIKRLLLKRYRSHFSEFNNRVLRYLSVKDKVRFLTFKINPHIYLFLHLSYGVK